MDQFVGTWYRDYYPLDGATKVILSNNLIDSINPLFFSQYGLYGDTGFIWVDLSYNNISGAVNWLPYVLSIYQNLPTGGNLLLNNNSITNINTGVYADTFDIRNNPGLNCLPFLFGTECLLSSGTNATCTADIPEAIWNSDMGLAVCQANNPNNCPVESESGGITFNDLNQNGVLDGGEVAVSGIYLTMQPGNFMHVSDSIGKYGFQCMPATWYTITALPTFPYRMVTSPPFQEYFNTLGLADTFRNMGIYTIPNVNDMVVYLTPYTSFARPGFHQQYSLEALNQGTTVQNGNVVMYFDSSALWFQSSNPLVNSNGQFYYLANN